MTYPRRALISSLIVVGILVSGCGSPGAEPASGDDPQAVAERFAEALERSFNAEEFDVAEVTALVCDQDSAEVQQKTMERRTLWRNAGRRPELTATGVAVKGDRGVFTVTYRYGDGGEPMDHPYELVREGGGWRVCLALRDGPPVPATR